MMKYYVTWSPETAPVDMIWLTVIDGDLVLTPDQIMEIVYSVEDMEFEDYTIHSIIRAADAEIIC